MALALISIAVLDAVLGKLIVSRIDPGLIQYSLGPEPGQYGMGVVPSAQGFLVWLVVVAIWAGILAHLQGFVSNTARWAAVVGLFGVQSLVILVFHPLLLVLILGGLEENSALRVLSRWHVLAEIYEHSGLSRNLHWVFACQLGGTLAVVATAHFIQARQRSEDSKPPAAKS